MAKQQGTGPTHIAVTIFRDFVQDHRPSMEVYADGLGQAMATVLPERYELKQYRPVALGWTGRNAPSTITEARLSRFVGYPWQARRHQGQINHVIDQGYGHLLYAIDPRRTVVTVHDVIPLLYWRGSVPGVPHGHKPWLSCLSFGALRRAAHIIADSENTRRDVVALCGVSAEKITVVPLGVDGIFRPYQADRKMVALRDVGLQAADVKRVLVVGCASYKNNIGALRAFARLNRLCAGRLQLVVVGSPDQAWADEVETLGLRTSTVVLHDLPRAKMPDLYNSVDCLLFPSLYEGFGWPPLEAMACGLPVVASRVAALPEVVGDAGVMVDPQDYNGLADAMAGVLTDDDYRRELVNRGLLRARQFTWDQTARRTLAVYEKILNDLGKA